jgi:hypothetical protein
MKRVLALVIAAAMVAGSLYVRSRIDDDNDGGDTASTPSALRIVCSTELAAACDGLDGPTRVEDAGVTADGLVGAAAPTFDVWIVPDPWPALVDVRRRHAQQDPLFGDAAVVATTRLGLAAWKGDVACPTPVTWKCVGEKGARAGHADPASDGIGLLTLGNAVASFFGRTDLSTADLDEPAFDSWFAQLEQRGTINGDALDLMFSSRGALFDAVAVTEIDVRAVVENAANRERVEVSYPAPMATAGAVVAARRGVQIDRALPARAADALVGAGWTRDGRTAGIPDAGFLDALLERWHEVVG